MRLYRFPRWLRRAAAAVCLAAAPAQAAELPLSACPTAAMRIVVIGDSLADGLWGAFRRAYARCSAIDVVRLTEVSDGLAKTSDTEWAERYAASGGGKTDMVVVQIGANDITFIRNGRSREPFDTETWTALYRDRVAGLTRALQSGAGAVIWLGLPVVGKGNLEGPYRTISTLQKQAVTAAGGAFVDIHDVTTFGTGDFAMNGDFDGRLQQLRASDKVHFTATGYDLVAGEILDDLGRFITATDRRAALQDVQLQ